MNTHYIEEQIQSYRNTLLNHSLYDKINDVADLRIFLEGHVYAVWDFMSLLKALQQVLTCTTTPWIPYGNPQIRYLINEIVLAEETDEGLDGKRASHYEMYLDAMQDSEADTAPITQFLTNIQNNGDIFLTIERSNLPQGIKDFLTFTFETIKRGKAHEIAAAFTFGREGLIPDMFTSILKSFQASFPEADLKKLIYYFERHIELDGDEHGPMAMQMISELCGDDGGKWKEVESVSIAALKKRIGLWDAIEKQVIERKKDAILAS